MSNAEKQMDAVIRILEDQKHYSVSEIAPCVSISAKKIELFLRFLAKYGFVTYDENRKKAIICADFLLHEHPTDSNLDLIIKRK